MLHVHACKSAFFTAPRIWKWTILQAIAQYSRRPEQQSFEQYLSKFKSNASFICNHHSDLIPTMGHCLSENSFSFFVVWRPLDLQEYRTVESSYSWKYRDFKILKRILSFCVQRVEDWFYNLCCELQFSFLISLISVIYFLIFKSDFLGSYIATSTISLLLLNRGSSRLQHDSSTLGAYPFTRCSIVYNPL